MAILRKEPETRSESLAEPRPARRWSLGLGLVGAVGLAAAAALSWTSPAPVRVPAGIAGTRFGMTEAELKHAVPGLESEAGPGLPAGHQRSKGKTTLFDVPVTCRFDVAEMGLVRVECLAPAQPHREAHEAAEQRWLAALRGLYGGESESRGGRTSWRGADARLEVTSQFDAASETSILRVVNERTR